MNRALQTVAGLTIVASFGVCALTLAGPVTPIQFDVGPVADLLNPQFSQNWQLFAPDPISDERGVVVRLRCGGKVSPWTDITSASIATTQASRFFPARESRIVSNALIERFAQDDISKRLSAEHKSDLLQGQSGSKHRAEKVLARYAARVVVCPIAGETATAVQLRYVIRSLPPWSHRNDPRAVGKTRTLDSEWIGL